MLFLYTFLLDASLNVMAHAQKPDFICWRNGQVHLNRWGCQFIRLLAAKVCASAFVVGSNAGYTMFQSSAKSTGYPLHLQFSLHFPSCAPLCAITFHLESTMYRIPTKGIAWLTPCWFNVFIPQISTVKITYDIQEHLQRNHVSYTTENTVKTKKELNVF